MTRRDLVALACAAIVIGAAPCARAADEVDPSALRAEQLAADAEAKIAAGAYADAVELYLAAYKESPAAVLLYDAAVVYDRRLGARTVALEYYRRALAAGDLDESVAARARARVAELEPAAPASATPPSPAPVPAVAVVPPPSGGWPPLRIAAVATAGAGVVALGTGVVLGIIARSRDDEAGTYCDGDRCRDPRALTLTDQAVGLAHGADVAFVVGAALLAGGVVMWLLAPSRTRSAALGPRGARWGVVF